MITKKTMLSLTLFLSATSCFGADKQKNDPNREDKPAFYGALGGMAWGTAIGIAQGARENPAFAASPYTHVVGCACCVLGTCLVIPLAYEIYKSEKENRNKKKHD